MLLENQTQWSDKTKRLSKLVIVKKNAFVDCCDVGCDVTKGFGDGDDIFLIAFIVFRLGCVWGGCDGLTVFTAAVIMMGVKKTVLMVVHN